MARGQKLGFKHREETKQQISKTLEGKRPVGFLQKKICSTCGEQHNVSNLPRHQRACEERNKYARFFTKSITIQELKGFRGGIKRNFNMTLDDYGKHFDKQNGLCAICKKPQVSHKKTLSVDHCHKTGVVRGLLCDKCNMSIGLLEDDPMILETALKYINEHKD